MDQTSKHFTGYICRGVMRCCPSCYTIVVGINYNIGSTSEYPISGHTQQKKGRKRDINLTLTVDKAGSIAQDTHKLIFRALRPQE